MAGDVEKVTGFCDIPNPARRYPLGGIFYLQRGAELFRASLKPAAAAS